VTDGSLRNGSSHRARAPSLRRCAFAFDWADIVAGARGGSTDVQATRDSRLFGPPSLDSPGTTGRGGRVRQRGFSPLRLIRWTRWPARARARPTYKRHGNARGLCGLLALIGRI